MRENLRTTKYNDGTPIAGNLSNTAWENTREGAFAIYENNSQYDLLYGKLYNGYAVATGKLCPKGWRVPADSDWQQLERIVGIIEDLGILRVNLVTTVPVFRSAGRSKVNQW